MDSKQNNQLDGMPRTKPAFECIQLNMAAAGYDQTVEHINKLKKEHKDWTGKWAQKDERALGSSGWKVQQMSTR